MRTNLKGAGFVNCGLLDRHLKGAGFAWIFGLFMVLLIVAIFVTSVVSHYNEEVMVVSGAIEAYDTMHTAEFTKRTLDGAAFANGIGAVEELAPSGGGNAVWSNVSPGVDRMKSDLETGILQRMNLITFNGLNMREIIWRGSNLTITDYSDDGFAFSGSRNFTVKTTITAPEMAVDNAGAYAARINTSYFKLARIGRAAATCPPVLGERTVENVNLTVRNMTTASDMVIKYSFNVTGSDGLSLLYRLHCA